ncbi:MAG: ABC transporter permease [Bacteroides sp.]|nr:ABC transporter permease [Roseburia sp.]MCM1347569.1 ABC transporter permease [Bacteroides sp.]MCM1421197.1 ABC transporter permease [Bacteroides sp.]
MLDTLQEIWGAVMRNKLRTAATGFAVAGGIFLLIVLLGAGNGIIHTLDHNSEGFALDAVHIYGGYTSMPLEGIKDGRRIRLDARDGDMAERTFGRTVAAVSPTVSRSASSIVSGNRSYSNANLTGAYPEHAKVDRVKILCGRFINDFDIKEKRKTIIIDEKAEKELFGKGQSAIGKMIKVDNIAYKVVGISENNFMFGSSDFYIPFTTLQTIYGQGCFIDELTLQVRGLDTEEKNDHFVGDYRKATGRLHSFNPEDKRAIWIWNSASENVSMSMAKNILHTSFWILGLLTLLSGVVGVSNIMLITVKERTHEFGIRKALGAKPWSIIRMVMLESILITTLFGYIGMVCGVGFCEYMDATAGNQVMDAGIFQQEYFIDPTVDVRTCIQATLVMVISGAVAGFIPARKAAKVKPIEALRAN